MTTCTRVTTNDGDTDVTVHKVEEEEEVEDVDVDVATRTWEGEAIDTYMATARMLEAIAEHWDQTISTMRHLQI